MGTLELEPAIFGIWSQRYTNCTMMDPFGETVGQIFSYNPRNPRFGQCPVFKELPLVCILERSPRNPLQFLDSFRKSPEIWTNLEFLSWVPTLISKLIQKIYQIKNFILSEKQAKVQLC